MEKFKDDVFFSNLISAYMRSTNEGLFTTHTVGELLWGYKDGLLSALKVVQPGLDDMFGLFYKVCLSNPNPPVHFPEKQDLWHCETCIVTPVLTRQGLHQSGNFYIVK